MPRIRYEEKNLGKKKLALIRAANEIIREYAAQGFSLTLRQIYYQFIARDMLPNTVASYKMLGVAISDGRTNGLIDWNAIFDDLRKLDEVDHWDNPEHLIDFDAGYFRLDKWEGQEYRPEVYVEKAALGTVIEKACIPLDVGRFKCRGYMSQSAIWTCGRRYKRMISAGQTPVIIHLGDHDPSGIDMTRDNQERASMFAEMGVEIRRIALNMDQVEEYEPPSNPAKLTDTRASKYIEEYGYDSWELDALEPSVIVDLITEAVLELRDDDLWDALVEVERKHRKNLRMISDNWDEVEEYVRDNFDEPEKEDNDDD